MDYEKAYKEALERCKSWMKGEHPECFNEAQKAAEFIFPELKESEDEMIRKEIIQSIQDNMSVINKDKCIAWLEKQGVQKADNNVVLNFIDDEYSLKKCEQKSTDKVEPKFKVGDWCIDNEDNTVFQITKVLSNLYYYKTNEGKEYSCTRDSIERDAHLWTIQDAEYGDVLQLDKVTAIFKKFIGNEKCICYCSISEDLDFEIPIKNGKDNIYGCTNTTPATKEQRDTLMKAMAEAGYTFDFEKKELKKIDKKVMSDKEKAHQIAWETSKHYDPLLSKESWCEMAALDMASWKNEHKPSWSEEDEMILNWCIADIERAKYCKSQTNPGLCDQEINYLKSLKPHWKPSEEQMEALFEAKLASTKNREYFLGLLYEDLKNL